MLLGTVLGVGGSRLVPRTFRATSTLVREGGSEPGQDASRGGKNAGDAFKLPSNVAEVRRRLGLSMTLEKLATRFDVEVSADSSTATIKADAPTADEAVILADALAAVVLDQRRRLARERAMEVASAVAVDVASTRGALLRAHQAWADFRGRHGAIDIAAERAAAVERAARLRAEADVAAADATGEEARERSLRKTASGVSPTITLSERIGNPAATRLRDAETERAALSGRLSPEHPRLRALAAEVSALRDEAARPHPPIERVSGPSPEWGDLKRGVNASRATRVAAVRRREVLLDLAFEAASRADDLAALEGQAAELTAAARSAEARLAELETALLRAEEATRSPAAGMRVASPALRPDLPHKSYRRPVVLATPLLFALLTALWLIGESLRGLRAESPLEVAYHAHAPVIACQEVFGAASLAADVAVSLPAVVRTLLVVPAGEVEAPLAAALAAALDAELAKQGGRARATAEPSSIETRRAARDADTVLLLVEAGAHTPAELSAHGMATPRLCVAAVGVGPHFAPLGGRVGEFSLKSELPMP